MNPGAYPCWDEMFFSLELCLITKESKQGDCVLHWHLSYLLTYLLTLQYPVDNIYNILLRLFSNQEEPSRHKTPHPDTSEKQGLACILLFVPLRIL